MITNYMSPLEFIVTVKGLPNVEFFTQRATIPSISLVPVERANPFKTLYEPGDRITYSELNLSFIVDEQMNNYIEVLNWMKGVTFAENFDQYKNVNEDGGGIVSDISVVVKNSHKNPSIVVDYFDCFPISLSEIQLDTTQQDLTYPEATVVFQYNYFDIKQID